MMLDNAVADDDSVQELPPASVDGLFTGVENAIESITSNTKKRPLEAESDTVCDLPNYTLRAHVDFLKLFCSIRVETIMTMDMSKDGIRVYAMLHGKSVACLIHLALADCKDDDAVVPDKVLRFSFDYKSARVELLKCQDKNNIVSFTTNKNQDNICLVVKDGQDRVLREIMIKSMLDSDAPEPFDFSDMEYTNTLTVAASKMQTMISADTEDTVWNARSGSNMFNMRGNSDMTISSVNVYGENGKRLLDDYSATFTKHVMGLVKRVCASSCNTIDLGLDQDVPLRVHLPLPVPIEEKKRKKRRKKTKKTK